MLVYFFSKETWLLGSSKLLFSPGLGTDRPHDMLLKSFLEQRHINTCVYISLLGTRRICLDCYYATGCLFSAVTRIHSKCPCILCNKQYTCVLVDNFTRYFLVLLPWHSNKSASLYFTASLCVDHSEFKGAELQKNRYYSQSFKTDKTLSWNIRIIILG